MTDKMAKLVLSALFFLVPVRIDPGQHPTPRIIHIFVALCDNVNQGIIPVPDHLGNGEDPRGNLYWGARYGLRTFFERSNDWELFSVQANPRESILERCIFRRNTSEVYLLADAYRGDRIKQTLIDFLQAAAGNNAETLNVDNGSHHVLLGVGGSANLIGYVGHNGLMDFTLDDQISGERRANNTADVIILACSSKPFFSNLVRQSGATPLLWTTGLMAPEAYTLKSAIDGWIRRESPEQIRNRAAEAYHRYQGCMLNAARQLFVSGW